MKLSISFWYLPILTVEWCIALTALQLDLAAKVETLKVEKEQLLVNLNKAEEEVTNTFET